VSRNYPANQYRYRGESHFIYFAGVAIEGAALLVADGRATLFASPPDRDDALWHGPRPSLEELRDARGVDEVRSLGELGDVLGPIRGDVAVLPPQDAATAAWLGGLLARPISAGSGARLEVERDAKLADAVISLRLQHDEGAAAQLRAAALVSARAHVAGMRATRTAKTEAEVLAAMLAVLRAEDMDDAYGPIVSVRGEILHSRSHDGALGDGDLLLCDVGGESPEGWASDITRTWPTSGAFSASQRAIYDVVLASNRAAIERVRVGTRYRDVHETAKRVLVEGLVALGIFKGSVDGLLERGAAALFFPHGVGHLLGLDVHDMEDLGDRAGYAPGRSRSARFGDRYLRLDRDLAVGMAVTIEPGFYQVPGILSDPELTGPLGADLDRGVLARYADVRGIRIEDDVLCTTGDPEVMTRSCPKSADDVEATIRG
jgi:Xaa-Pro aminopeptidase